MNKVEKTAEQMIDTPPRSDSEIFQWKWKNEVMPHLQASGLPNRFHQIIEDWPQQKQKTVYENALKLLQGKGAIIALVGKRGAGKTTIASQIIAKRALDESIPPWHRRPPYRKLSALVARFKPLHSDFGCINMEELIRHAESLTQDHPLLIIDEIHDCEDQKGRDKFLTDFIDRRYANLVDTILISNQTVQDFQATIGESILSRLSEHGAILSCSWPSFREPTQ